MGDVNEHASADDPVRVGCNIESAGTPARDRIRRPTVIKLALVRDMTESVDMRVAVPVKLDSQEVRGEANVPRTDVHVMRGVHVIEGGIRIIRAGDGVDRDRQRYASATPDERGGGANF